MIDLGLDDWDGDAYPRRPFERTVIYEMHVGRFTRHPGSGVADPDAAPLPDLSARFPICDSSALRAVELLPVFAFDEQDAPAGLVNDWGYQPISFFAPHPGYSSRQTATEVLDDFRDMVKALHRAGIEVILDVVFNHTTEGGADGPTICFRGFANATYYILNSDKATYADYTGCGNTLNANEPVVRRMIIDSLRHWVREMHVDGFRFDLAAILSRDEQGRRCLRRRSSATSNLIRPSQTSSSIAEAGCGARPVGYFVWETLEVVDGEVPRRCPRVRQGRP